MRRILVALVILFAFVHPVSADIGFNAATYSGYVASGTSLTFAHTTSSSTNGAMTACVKGDFSDIITGATYNGVSMTLVGKLVNGGLWTYMYYLLNPAAGTHNVVVSASGTSFLIQAEVETLIGVKQTSNPTTSTTSSNTSAPLTTTRTSTADGSWMVECAASSAGIDTGGYVNFVKRAEDLDFNTMTIGDYGPIANGVSQGMTFDAPGDNTSIVAMFAPATFAVEYDTALYAGFVTTTTQTFSFTPVGGVGSYIFVCTAGDLTTDYNPAMTFNGVTMPRLASFHGIRWMYLHGLAAPASGPHNVVVTMTGGTYIQSLVSAYTGVAGISSITSTNNTGSQLDSTITTTHDNAFAAECFQSSGGYGTLTNFTERVHDTDFSGMIIGDHGPVHPAGSVTMSVDSTAQNNSFMWEIYADSGGSSTGKFGWTWLLGGFR